MARYGSDSEGAVAVMVAIFIAFVGVALLAFALDMGSLRQSQRALVTDTDAAALAGAIELAEDWMENGGECGDRAAARGEAERVLAVNNPDDEVISTDADCEPSPATAADFSGWVQMVAQQPSPGFVSGRDDLSAGGTSTAEFLLGVSDFEEGLAICGDLFTGTGEDALQESFELSGGRFAIPYHKAVQTLIGQLGTACGVQNQWLPPGGPAPTTPGGWGWLSGVCSPDLTLPSWCNVRVGTAGINGFGANIDRSIRFPIFDAWDGDPGTNADLRIVGFLQATVEQACRIPGGGNAPSNPADCVGPRLSNNFNGQPDFIIVSGAVPYIFDDLDVRMFDTATYSICDVQGDRRFCRSRG